MHHTLDRFCLICQPYGHAFTGIEHVRDAWRRAACMHCFVYLIATLLQGVNLMGGTKPPKLKIEDDDKTYIQR